MSACHVAVSDLPHEPDTGSAKPLIRANRTGDDVGGLEDLNASTRLVNALVVDREQALSEGANAAGETDSQAAELR